MSVRSWLRPVAREIGRAAHVGRIQFGSLRTSLWWLIRSREATNFTYDIGERNKRYLAETLAIATGQPVDLFREYIAELETDRDLKGAITAGGGSAKYGRRMGWYALARALRPRLVIETGVERGLGASVICAALRRNGAAGYPGWYIGTDINPAAGALLVHPYRACGEIRVGDSIETLSKVTEPVDLFINDSDHSAEYERREYETIARRLSARAVVLGDNAHATTELAEFSARHGRSFLFFKEEPVGHWYPGAGIGISFPKTA